MGAQAGIAAAEHCGRIISCLPMPILCIARYACVAYQAIIGSTIVLTSLMAKLRCEIAERSHVPAFVHFFQMLFHFGSAGPIACCSRGRG
jgi:hypothetical protein